MFGRGRDPRLSSATHQAAVLCQASFWAPRMHCPFDLHLLTLSWLVGWWAAGPDPHGSSAYFAFAVPTDRQTEVQQGQQQFSSSRMDR